jgi:3-methyladenine DNA glycosylase AlkC
MEPFKNAFDQAAVSKLAERVRAAYPAFEIEAFTRQAAAGLDALELKARVDHLAHALRAHLPEEVTVALQILVDTLGAPFDPDVPNSGSFQVWPLTAFVAHYGLDHPEASLDALHAMTQRFSGEFAIRPFLKLHPERTLARLRQWVEDPSAHVRRLVSEGTRTRLPWGERLPAFIADPSPVLPLIEALRSDPSEYVRRSVANHLNDLAKDHPALVVDITRRWAAEEAGAERGRLVRHALRTLVKAGDPRALAVLGFDAEVQVEVLDLQVSAVVQLGEGLDVSCALHNPGSTEVAVVLDLVVHHVKANGGRSPKVFKWTKVTLGPGETRQVKRRHPMRPVSIRRFYPGVHRVEVQVNGAVLAGAEFQLNVD